MSRVVVLPFVAMTVGCSLLAPKNSELIAGPIEPDDAGDVGVMPVGSWIDEPHGRIDAPDLVAQGALVVDRTTGLEWQGSVSAALYSASQADAACRTLTLDGKAGFRLPTRAELLSIVDLSIAVPKDGEAPEPAIRAEFGATPSDSTWTSTPSIGAGDTRWTVSFYDGVAARQREGVLHVRCVRGGNSTSGPRFAVEGNDIRDLRTGLAWRRVIEDGLFASASASAACARRGYRLPTELELESIVDTRRRSPAIDPLFAETPRETFWSSTLNATYDYYSWAVSFETGEAVYANRDAQFRVRCVH